MRFDSLNDALVHELQDLYSAEKQLIAALPKMIAAASSQTLKTALQNHLEETKNQISRLDKAFYLAGCTAGVEQCEAMQGLIEEGEEILIAQGDEKVKDALLIGAAQRIEHYEIAGYGTARAFAKTLGLSEVADLLQETLDEESAADKKLTALAEDGWIMSGINTEAPKAANA